MIGTPVNFRSGTLLSIGEMFQLKIKGNIYYIHDFLKAGGNNIIVRFLIFD